MNLDNRTAAQLDLLTRIYRLGIAPDGQQWADCGGPAGTSLADRMESKGIPVSRYEQHRGGPQGSFGLVTSISLLGQVRSIEILDRMEGLVAKDGIFAIHADIGREAPDPSTFGPGSASFFTDAAMAHLFKRWGYESSVFDPAAMLWLCLRQPEAEAHNISAQLRGTIAGPGFVGSWTTELAGAA